MKHNKNIMVGGSANVDPKTQLVQLAGSLVKYSIASAISLLFYIPTYLLNVPDNTLENLLPEGSCKFLFNDEEMCKNKVKCLFKECTKLNYIQLRGGGTPIIINNKKKRKINKRVKKKINKTRNIKQRGGSYFRRGDEGANVVNRGGYKIIPTAKTLKRGQGLRNLEQVSNKQANRLKSYIDESMPSIFQQQIRPESSAGVIEKPQKDAGPNEKPQKDAGPIKKRNKKFYLNDDPEYNHRNVYINTCINKKNKSFCNLRKNEISYGTDNYENGFIYKALYGRNNTKEITNNMKKMSQVMIEVARNNDSHLFDKQQLEATLTDQLSEESLYKFLVIIYSLYIYYDDEVEPIEEDDDRAMKRRIESKQDNISVVFPYTIYDKDISLDEKASCLFKHITERNVDTTSIHAPDYIKKCFKCDKCTLLNTGMKVLDGYFSYFEKLMGGSYNQLEVLIPSLYYLLTKYAVDSKFKDYNMNQMKDLLYKNINYVDSDLINNIELKSNIQPKIILGGQYNNTELVQKIYLNFNDEERDYNNYGRTTFYGENDDTYSLLFLMPNLQKKAFIPNSDEEKNQSYFLKESSGDLKQVYRMIKHFGIKPMIEKLYLKKLYQEFDVLKRDLNQDNTALIKKLLKDKLKSYKDHLNDLKIKINEGDSKTNINIQELFEKLNENENKERTYKEYIESFNGNS